jgi:hypothetical protein
MIELVFCEETGPRSLVENRLRSEKRSVFKVPEVLVLNILILTKKMT